MMMVRRDVLLDGRLVFCIIYWECNEMGRVELS